MQLDPLRKPTPPFGRIHPRGSELDRAFRLRRDYGLNLSLSRMRLGYESKFLLLLPLSAGVLAYDGRIAAAIGGAVLWLVHFTWSFGVVPRLRRREWSAAYTAASRALAQSGYHAVSSSEEFWQALEERSGADAPSRSITTLLLRAARDPQFGGSAVAVEPGIFKYLARLPGEAQADEAELNTADWARYAALYDFCFQ